MTPEPCFGVITCALRYGAPERPLGPVPASAAVTQVPDGKPYELRALRERHRRPLELRRLGCGDSGVHVAFGGHFHLLDELARRRVQILDETALDHDALHHLEQVVFFGGGDACACDERGCGCDFFSDGDDEIKLPPNESMWEPRGGWQGVLPNQALHQPQQPHPNHLDPGMHDERVDGGQSDGADDASRPTSAQNALALHMCVDA